MPVTLRSITAESSPSLLYCSSDYKWAKIAAALVCILYLSLISCHNALINSYMYSFINEELHSIKRLRDKRLLILQFLHKLQIFSVNFMLL